MRIAGPNDRLCGVVRLAAVLGAVAVVAGCSSGGSLSSLTGSMPSWFTRAPANTAATDAQASVSVAGKTLENDCPSVDIRAGAATLAVSGKSAESTATDLRYQLTFIEMARQCFVDGSTVRIRVGVQGRAIVGPAGAPPQATAPIRYTVVQEGVHPKTIASKFRRVPVTLDPVNSTTFTDIEEDLSFPMPSLADLQKYVVYIGFDEAGDRGQPQARKKAPAKAPPKPQKKLERSVAPEFRRDLN